MNPYNCCEHNATIFNELIFEPLNSFMSCGDNIQICKTNYLGIDIYIRTIFWYNIFKEPSDTFTVDLNLPMDTIIDNGSMENIYHEDGYGSPVFNTLEYAIEYIKNYTNDNKCKTSGS